MKMKFFCNRPGCTTKVPDNASFTYNGRGYCSMECKDVVRHEDRIPVDQRFHERFHSDLYLLPLRLEGT